MADTFPVLQSIRSIGMRWMSDHSRATLQSNVHCSDLNRIKGLGDNWKQAKSSTVNSLPRIL